MSPQNAEGALFLCRRVLSSALTAASGVSCDLPKSVSICVSPFGVRFGFGDSSSEEKQKSRLFLASPHGGFRYDAPSFMKPGPQMRKAQEGLWAAMPESAKSVFITAAVSVDLTGKTVFCDERTYVYNRRCYGLRETLRNVTRPLPDGFHPEPAELRAWTTVSPTSRDLPLIIPARSESEAAIRAVFRLSKNDPFPIPEAADLRVVPLSGSSILEISKRSGLFSPRADNSSCVIFSL